jgi:hypothetical protein
MGSVILSCEDVVQFGHLGFRGVAPPIPKGNSRGLPVDVKTGESLVIDSIE